MYGINVAITEMVARVSKWLVTNRSPAQAIRFRIAGPADGIYEAGGMPGTKATPAGLPAPGQFVQVSRVHLVHQLGGLTVGPSHLTGYTCLPQSNRSRQHRARSRASVLV